MPYGLLSLVTLALLVFCLADAITRDDAEVRHLPKLLWIFIILIMPLVGSALWLVIGRPPLRWNAAQRPRARYSEYDRPGRLVPQDPAADEEFLRKCRERAEEQRRIGKEILRAQRAEEERGKQEQDGS
ncbi:MAG: PLD nuclease N-terminal domain-containing protein [Segniliparus sp.]|uniref:PLD nuclease N-terminal domain-containing protein n=1 Tax=Segniliparus sp. TaxID=2804064 RepID=UPI003F2A9809